MVNLHLATPLHPVFDLLLANVEEGRSEPVPLADEGSRLETFFNWVDASGFAGAAAFVGVFVLAALVLAPASILPIAAGWIWGLGRGYGVLAVGMFLASTAGFFISRKIGRKRLLARYGDGPKFSAIDDAIRRDGIWVIFLLRLAPVFPFGVSNYAWGLSGVRYLPYIAATMVGLLPGALVYLYAGSQMRAGVEGEPETLKLTVRGMAFVALFGGFWFLGRICRTALRSADPRQIGEPASEDDEATDVD